jgi:hypothetical protein
MTWKQGLVTGAVVLVAFVGTAAATGAESVVAGAASTAQSAVSYP